MTQQDKDYILKQLEAIKLDCNMFSRIRERVNRIEAVISKEKVTS